MNQEILSCSSYKVVHDQMPLTCPSDARLYLLSCGGLTYIYSAKIVLYTWSILGYKIKTIMLMDMYYVANKTTIKT